MSAEEAESNCPNSDLGIHQLQWESGDIETVGAQGTMKCARCGHAEPYMVGAVYWPGDAGYILLADAFSGR